MIGCASKLFANISIDCKFMYKPFARWSQLNTTMFLVHIMADASCVIGGFANDGIASIYSYMLRHRHKDQTEAAWVQDVLSNCITAALLCVAALH